MKTYIVRGTYGSEVMIDTDDEHDARITALRHFSRLGEAIASIEIASREQVDRYVRTGKPRIVIASAPHF